MMAWVLVIGLALVVFGLVCLVFRAPRASWEVVGAALLLGVAGYALQGSPGFPGAPKTPAERQSSGAADIAARDAMGEGAVQGDKHLVIADALARHGQYADAAEVLRGAVKKDPTNAAAWLSMANDLVGHAEGTISPAAIYAYGRAAEAAPDSAGPPFFMGLALIRSGRFDEGRTLWADLLGRSPKEAPWRADLQNRLTELDAFLARQGQGAMGSPAVPK